MIASASLGPGTSWDCFCFRMMTKDASTALLCGKRQCCSKESDPRLTLTTFFMDSSRYTSNTTLIWEFLFQYVMPTWKWHQKLQQRTCYCHELFEQGSWHQWCKLTIEVSLLLTIHFLKLSAQGGLAFLFQCAVTPSDHDKGSSGWASTDLMSNFLLVAISTLWPNNLWSAFRTVSLWVLLATLSLFIYVQKGL